MKFLLTSLLVASMACATPAPTDSLPLTIGVVLFPGFQNQDVFGPLDVFQGASMYVPGGLTLYLISSSLDPVSTRNPAMPSKFGFEITPTHTFANAPKDIDVLLVPGGMGTRGTPEVLDPARKFVTKRYRKNTLKYLLTVCTGSALIGPTGLLDGKNATTNKASWAWATSQGPNVNWVKEARWVVDGDIWTSSGIMAGIDMSFAWIAHVYNGKVNDPATGAVVLDLGKKVADRVEYERHTDPSWDPFAKIWGLVGNSTA